MSSDPSLLAAGAAQEVPWKSLSPRAPLAALVPVVAMVVRSLGGALLPAFLMADHGYPAYIWGTVIAVALFGVFGGLYEVATLRYRVVDGQLEIHSGLFTKSSRFIEAARVQNTEVLQPFVSKLLGLVELKVETASGQKADGHLRGLEPAEAQAIIDALHAARGLAVPTLGTLHGGAGPEGEVLAQARLVDLLRYGATASGLGVLAVVLGTFNELMEVFQKRVLPWMMARWEALGRPGMGWVSVTLAVLTGVLALWAVNVVLALLRFHGFRLVETAGHFRAVSGLVTRRQVTVRRERMQQVVVDEPLLRRWLGFGSVEVETAGVRTGSEPAERAELLVPVVPTPGLEPLVQRLIPELPSALHALPWRPAHPRALLRARIRAVGFSLLLAVPATVFLGRWGALAWVLLPLLLTEVWFDWRFQGWLITESLVVVRQGFWRRRTTVLQRARIQSVKALQGPLERGYGIGRVHVAVAGSDVTLPCVGWEEAQRLIDVLPPPRRTGGTR